MTDFNSSSYLLTGVTGLVGSHLLFELLLDRKSRPGLTIHCLTRSQGELSAKERIYDILDSPDRPDYLGNATAEELLSFVRVIEGDLTNTDLTTAFSEIAIDDCIVIHAAASTDLRELETTQTEIINTNHLGTLQLYASVRRCRRFVFISTAYACGIREERIPNSFKDLPDMQFRNAYEEQKYEIEQKLMALTAQAPEQLKIIRPSIICGRLMDSGHFFTSKFDVFYGWQRFFWQFKKLVERSGIRLAINPKGTLNIIPVDYFAKVALSFIHRDQGQELNVTHSAPADLKDFITHIFEVLDIRNYQVVYEIPENMSAAERLYYNGIGRIFNPYVMRDNARYDHHVLHEIKGSIPEPPIKSYLKELTKFALERKFQAGYRPAVKKAS